MSFIANAYELNSITENKTDYVDLLSDDKNLQKKIKRLVQMKNFFPACDFCVGRPKDPTTAQVYDGKGIITAGVQTKNPIPYNEID